MPANLWITTQTIYTWKDLGIHMDISHPFQPFLLLGQQGGSGILGKAYTFLHRQSYRTGRQEEQHNTNLKVCKQYTFSHYQRYSFPKMRRGTIFTAHILFAFKDDENQRLKKCIKRSVKRDSHKDVQHYRFFPSVSHFKGGI